jgi:hypothetical protein
MDIPGRPVRRMTRGSHTTAAATGARETTRERGGTTDQGTRETLWVRRAGDWLTRPLGGWTVRQGPGGRRLLRTVPGQSARVRSSNSASSQRGRKRMSPPTPDMRAWATDNRYRSCARKSTSPRCTKAGALIWVLQ